MLQDYINRNFKKDYTDGWEVFKGNKIELLNTIWLDSTNVIVSFKVSHFVMYPVKSYGTIKNSYCFEHLTIQDDRVKSIWFNRDSSLKAHKQSLKVFLNTKTIKPRLTLVG